MSTYTKKFLIFLLVLAIQIPVDLSSQDTDSLRQIFTPQGGEKKNPQDEEIAKSVSDTQKKMIQKHLNTLTDREVEDYLRQLGVTGAGSPYSRRRRLRSAVGADETLSPEKETESLLKKQDSMPIVIENATEGEMVQVDKTKSGVMVLRGNVKLKLNTGTLSAETITVDSKRQEIYAEGSINYKDGNIKVDGDKFIYDVKLNRGVIYNTRASMAPAYFIGKKIKKLDENRFLLEMGYFTACNAEIPHYSFKAGKIVIKQDESVIATNLRVYIGPTPVFWFPMYYTSNLGSGWVTQIGKNQTQGWFWQNTYQWSVPSYIASTILPVGYKAKLDIYEKTGQAVALDTWKVSPHLNYLLDFGFANFKRYQMTPAYDDRFQHGGIGSVAITNQVDRGEKYPNMTNALSPYGYNNRDVGVEYQPWWKHRFIMNAKTSNTEKDTTRNVQVNYENYKNLMYEYEFGNRYEPTNTLRSIYNRRNVKMGMMRQNLNWVFDYTENRGDLSVNMSMKRVMNYHILNPRDKSGYFPSIDEVPKVNIRNSTQIGTIPYFLTPIYWDLTFFNSITRYWGSPTKKELPFQMIPTNSTDMSSWIYLGKEDPHGNYKESLLRTQILTMGETGFRTNLNPFSYMTYTPAVYYGARKEVAERPNKSNTLSTGDIAQDNALRRESYQFVRQNHNVRLGAPILFLNTTYRKVEVNKAEMPDRVVGKNRTHEMEIALESYSLQDWEFSVRTIRDLRKPSSEYNPQPLERERWYFTIARASGFIDFVDGFGEKRVSLLERQRSFYSGIFINNDYVHHTPKNKPLSNNLTLAWQMGGFSLPFIKNFKKIEVGATWYHIYASPFIDRYRFYTQADVQITKLTSLELELDSRVTQPWRYTDQTAAQNSYIYSQESYYSTSSLYKNTTFAEDLKNGTGVSGQEKRQKTAFNINRFLAVFKVTFHNWDFRLGYSMDLRALPGGSSFDQQLTFYDQSVFVSISLNNLSLGQDEGTESSRRRVYRFRKKPLDVGQRSDIISQ